MKLRLVIGFGVVLASAALPAMAFQEQRSGGAPPAEAGAPAAAAPAAPDADLKFSTPKAGDGGASSGTEVRIPGLGKLGVLPKMDFGLELLYGANEQSKQVEPERDTPSDDLTIRGSVKHNF